ncbi:DUF4397 domain-containing protein [Pedobacter sp. HMWF019]|uniref:DUF4397 domain-containing protein n=1 Tax=Pedobacter sp. HMWF019 TaxID=2056856 RepID=UPI000D3AACF9|nr:DUF4397 domain-containing protein [Pedobacter sp. HMWF019]PTS99144.1 DUF4397 domain-containing protein [Pedobacter sp. HMWF019]
MSALNRYTKHFFQLSLLVAMAFSACKKDKLDMNYDNRKVTDPSKGSMVRIVNLAGYNQVQANGDTLTNYVVRDPQGPIADSYPATKYFRDNGRLGSTWIIQQDLFGKGALKLLTEDVSFAGRGQPTVFTVTDEQQPVDYYLPTTLLPGQPAYMKIPRAVSAPSDPSKFKIRILNLTSAVRSADQVEDLRVPLSLSWADGTLVSAKTNNIQPGQYSDYVELPYGAIQFKVLTAQGYQVSGANADVISAVNSTLVMSPNLTYAPIKTFFPGGIYTLVISARQTAIPYPGSSTGESYKVLQNTFQIINDIADPANLTYSRLQAVNAMPGMDGVKIRVNGQPLGIAMPYTGHTDYQSFIIGDYKIEAISASGAKLAETQLKLEANKNFSLWFYPGVNGSPVIQAVANDLSGNYFAGGTDDASSAYYKQAFPFNIRFLNFCPDFPYLTVTGNDGAAFNGLFPVDPNAVNNLMPGVLPINAPYVSMRQESAAYQLMAFRSTPAIIPGSWAKDISVITGQNLITRPELYVRTGLPNHEPGIYTVALVGSTKTNTPATQKAKMIILKHNK